MLFTADFQISDLIGCATGWNAAAWFKWHRNGPVELQRMPV